jgi:NAD(P)-dependent dehydrogenase (short-subunit alcohol dehydrogenase family)
MTVRSMKGNPAEGKGVLITGCSSGIGWATAVHLARQGLTVFATVRKEGDAERLRSLNEPNLIPVCPLDLTRLEQIPAVVDAIGRELGRRGQSGLFALIHNAGGGSAAPVELMDVAGFRRELDARLAGSVALTQALLPMIRQAQGRILWIMTPAMIPTPFVTSIHACDFAVNCLARTLDIELKPWGIPNIMIRCGGIKTETGLRTTADVEAILEKSPKDRASLYEQAMRRWGKAMAAFDVKRTDPERVAEVIFQALSAGQPKRRYSIGYMARAAAFLEALPRGWADRILKKRF